MSPAVSCGPGYTFAESGFGVKETAALLKVVATGVIVTGAGAAGFEAAGLLGAQTDLIQRSAASGDFGICLR
jgi:hypothetical protein